MKNIIQISILSLFCFKLFAQDIIVKNDKTEIKAKIEELTETTIKYKKFDMLDGPSYNINKRDVFMIMYKNGTKEYIESTTSQSGRATNEPQPPTVSNTPAKTQRENYVGSTNQNSISDNEKIDINGRMYSYKGKILTTWKEFDQIFAENNAIQSQQFMRKRKTQAIAGLALGSVGVVGSLIAVLTEQGFTPFSIISFGMLIGGSTLSSIAPKNVAKAINSYNSNIENRRVSFKPAFKKDKMGNHVGLNIRF